MFMLIRGIIYSIFLQVIFVQNAFAYLDPGTLSYVFQILIGFFVGSFFAIKMFWQKIKIFFSNLFKK